MMWLLLYFRFSCAGSSPAPPPGMVRITARRPPLGVSEAGWLFTLRSLHLKPSWWSSEAAQRSRVFHLGSSSEPSSAASNKLAAALALLSAGPRSQSPMEIGLRQPALHRQAGGLCRGVQDYDGGALAGRSGKQVPIPSLSPGCEPLAAFRRVLMQAALGQSQSSFRARPSCCPLWGHMAGSDSPLSTGRKVLLGPSVEELGSSWVLPPPLLPPLLPLFLLPPSPVSIPPSPPQPLPPVFLTLFIGNGQGWAELASDDTVFRYRNLT